MRDDMEAHNCKYHNIFNFEVLRLSGLLGFVWFRKSPLLNYEEPFLHILQEKYKFSFHFTV